MYFANSSCFDSLRKRLTFWDTAAGFPAKWCLRNKCRTSILMTHLYPDLGSASDWLKQIFHMEIRSTTLIWVVPRHQYGISSLFSRTSFCGETSGGIGKCRPFTQATFFIFLYIMLCIQMSYWNSLKRRNKQERMQRKKLMSLKVGPNIFSTCTVHKIHDFPTNQEEVSVIQKIHFHSVPPIEHS